MRPRAPSLWPRSPRALAGREFERAGTPRRRAEVTRAVGLSAAKIRKFQMFAVFREFCAWKKSAKQYAAAVELYGQACAAAGVQPWPPTPVAHDVMMAFCHRAGTLAYYFRAIRSVLGLLRADAGALELTRTLVQGARKARARTGREPLRQEGGCIVQAEDPAGGRFKSRATAGNVRAMATWLREEARALRVRAVADAARHRQGGEARYGGLLHCMLAVLPTVRLRGGRIEFAESLRSYHVYRQRGTSGMHPIPAAKRVREP